MILTLNLLRTHSSPTAFLDPAMIPLPPSPQSSPIPASYSFSPPYKHHDPTCIRSRRSPTPEDALADDLSEVEIDLPVGTNDTQAIFPHLSTDPFAENKVDDKMEMERAMRWYEDYSVDDLENSGDIDEDFDDTDRYSIIASASAMSLGGRACRP